MKSKAAVWLSLVFMASYLFISADSLAGQGKNPTLSRINFLSELLNNADNALTAQIAREQLQESRETAQAQVWERFDSFLKDQNLQVEDLPPELADVISKADNVANLIDSIIYYQKFSDRTDKTNIIADLLKIDSTKQLKEKLLEAQRNYLKVAQKLKDKAGTEQAKFWADRQSLDIDTVDEQKVDLLITCDRQAGVIDQILDYLKQMQVKNPAEALAMSLEELYKLNDEQLSNKLKSIQLKYLDYRQSERARLENEAKNQKGENATLSQARLSEYDQSILGQFWEENSPERTNLSEASPELIDVLLRGTQKGDIIMHIMRLEKKKKVKQMSKDCDLWNMKLDQLGEKLQAL